MRTIARRRWSDNDTYFGPFTFAWEPKYGRSGVMLCSGDDEDRGAVLRLHLGPLTSILALPAWLVPPHRRKVYPSPESWGPEVVARLGRDWYYDVSPREFGFTISGTGMIGESSALHVHFGRQTMDSSTEKSACYFLPWTEWRHVRHSLYGLDGALFAHLPQGRWDSPERAEEERLTASCPTAAFAFKDFDGEALTATTKIEEREWKRGEGWFKWLAWLSKPIIHRSLDIRFSGETGRRKGSWKGGTIGHSINMRPGELHQAAFERYCIEHDMTFGNTEPRTASA